MKTKIALGLTAILIPMFLSLTAQKSAQSRLSDFRDAPAEVDGLPTVRAKDMKNAGDTRLAVEIPTPTRPIPVAEGAVVLLKDIYPTLHEEKFAWHYNRPKDGAYYGRLSASTSRSPKPVEWISIPGGEFEMVMHGTKYNTRVPTTKSASVKSFDMSRTLVTVEQYAECVNKGKCKAPLCDYDIYKGCNWGRADRRSEPINGVSWAQAYQYAEFVGGGARLPSRIEWQYAATSGGKHSWARGPHPYPYPRRHPNNDIYYIHHRTLPVCNNPGGNTQFDGIPKEKQLCDITGEFSHMLQDATLYSDISGSRKNETVYYAVGCGYDFTGDPIFLDGCSSKVVDAFNGDLGFRLVRAAP